MKNPKKQNFEKTEKQTKNKQANKNTGDIITLHICTKNHNQVHSLRSGVTKSFCHLGPFFALYHPPNTKENQNFEKTEKASGDVIILNLCNKKHNQMMYAYSDMESDRYNFLSF